MTATVRRRRGELGLVRGTAALLPLSGSSGDGESGAVCFHLGGAASICVSATGPVPSAPPRPSELMLS